MSEIDNMNTDSDFFRLIQSDLTTRINSIIKEIEKIQKNEELTHQTQKTLENLSSFGVNLKERLTDFIDIYAFEKGVKSLKSEDINIINLIKFVKNNVSSFAKEKSILINAVFPEDKNVAMKGDAEYLKKSLEEIFTRLIAISQKKSTITINSKLKDNYIDISLIGKGIQTFSQFDIFFAKRIIELHKGNMLAESGKEDFGLIYIKLPISKEIDKATDIPDKDFILKLIDKEDELPSLSPVATKVISIASQEDITVKQISDIVKNDPSLAARILKIANSSLYSFRQKISTLTQAISLLGMSAVRNIALCISVLDSFPVAKVGGFDYRQFWEFSLCSALLCKFTARKVNKKLEEEAFLVGLLQNIGALIFAKNFPSKYSEIMENSLRDYSDITEMEIKEWGIDHPSVGNILLKKWNLPKTFSSAVLYHHKPERVPENDSGSAELAWLVNLSDKVVKFLNTSDSKFIEVAKNHYFEIFNIKPEQIDKIISDVSSEIKGIAREFNINIEEDINYAEILQRANIQLGKIVFSMEQANRELKKVIAEKIELAEKLKIANEKLEKQAITDGMTGIYNHRFFYEVLDKSFSESKRHNYPLSCIMADIDYFKIFNDTFGHKVGDQVLLKVASVIEKSVRNEDTVARYGGEEFSVLLPKTDEETARIVAERIRKSIENTTFLERLSRGQVTISLGVATYMQDKNWTSASALVEESDKALYMAKRNGRNRVEVT